MTTDLLATTQLPPAEGLDAPLGTLVSPDVGIVHRVDDGVCAWDHPRLAVAYAQLADTAPVLGAPTNARAGGLGASTEHARRTAIGEAIERYSASWLPASRFRSARSAELAGQPTVPPDWLEPESPRPGSAAGPDPELDPDPVVRWVDGVRLRAGGPGAPALVAVSRAFLTGTDDTHRVAVPTSTGLACHPDPWRALLSGLFEVIERDAVMTTWLTRAAVRPVRSPLRWRAENGATVRFDHAVEDYRLYLLPSRTGIPVVLGAAYGAQGQPPVAVGAAADLDLAAAARKALLETQQTFAWAALMMARGDDVPDDPDAFHDLDDHVRYYLDPARLPAFGFLRESAPATACRTELAVPRRPGQPRAAVDEVLTRLAEAGLSAYAVDVTAPDVRAAGLWVIRAIVPQLMPLILGRRIPPRPGLDLSEARTRPPHPFP